MRSPTPSPGESLNRRLQMLRPLDRQLTTFNKGLHTLPTTKKAGTPQSGFPLCLPITAVSFRTQLNSKDFLFLQSTPIYCNPYRSGKVLGYGLWESMGFLRDYSHSGK